MRLPILSMMFALACAGPSAVLAEGPGADSLPPDPAVLAADQAIEQGRPWRATQILAPALRDPERRTPTVVLTAARAAARWGGWAEVDSLLAGSTWLDSVRAGMGRMLLARSALHRGDDSLALDQARRAVSSANERALKGGRLVLLARAYDRLDQLDSAEAAYLEAAPMLPEIADWLLLRAAAVTTDGRVRAARYAALVTTVARERVRWVEASARERAGDVAGAAAAYDSLGAPVAALRLRLRDSSSAARLTGDDSTAIRHALMALLERRAGTSDARDAAVLLDESFAPLSAADELLLARSAASSGLAARAVRGFKRVPSASLGTSRDRYSYATMLSRLGREREAADQFRRVTSPASLAASAAYRRARSLLRAGDGAAARTALRHVIRDHRGDEEAASHALYLLADLATDEGRDAPAREAFREIYERYPTSTLAASAGFRAALIAFVSGAELTAAREMDALAKRHPDSPEALAALYWSGRAWSATGDTSTARSRWLQVERLSRLSYYSMLAARRLGRDAWAPPMAPDSFAVAPAADSALSRAARLERLGLTAEARFEYDYLTRHAGDSAEQILATAAAFRAHGFASRGISLAQRARERGATAQARVYRLLYPVSLDDALAAECRTHGLDPSLVAALIRQESRFNPRATSPVGARGLMQIMPPVGRTIATGMGYPAWDAALLYQPDVSLQLGTSHLAELLAGYADTGRALAAYNAGASRVTRWSKKLGTDDPEVFVERIPYRETRDYVRIVQRNRELYRSLYSWQQM
ncbi:MAG TPA: transglycosylase SLT domain-containing protein [Gemmatimonadaceae bacterium]